MVTPACFKPLKNAPPPKERSVLIRMASCSNFTWSAVRGPHDAAMVIVVPRSLRPRLLQPDGIATANRAASQDGGIDTHVGRVVPPCCPEDSQVCRQIPLGLRRLHAARARAAHAQT